MCETDDELRVLWLLVQCIPAIFKYRYRSRTFTGSVGSVRVSASGFDEKREDRGIDMPSAAGKGRSAGGSEVWVPAGSVTGLFGMRAFIGGYFG